MKIQFTITKKQFMEIKSNRIKIKYLVGNSKRKELYIITPNNTFLVLHKVKTRDFYFELLELGYDLLNDTKLCKHNVFYLDNDGVDDYLNVNNIFVSVNKVDLDVIPKDLMSISKIKEMKRHKDMIKNEMKKVKFDDKNDEFNIFGV